VLALLFFFKASDAAAPLAQSSQGAINFVVSTPLSDS
jgi:hypothetical protein